MIATATPRLAERQASIANRYRGLGDFMLLGGSSLFLLPLILLMPLQSGPVSGAMVFLALLINNPHFANSYQVFYRGFGERVSGQSPAVQRRRYLYAGVFVPLVIVGALAYCFVTENRTALGLAGDAMAFFVGWHYVKQGYGMLMVDGARTRRFFSKWEKQVLLGNSYAVWALGWILTSGSGQTRHLRGFAFYSFNLPEPIVYAAIAVTAATSIGVAIMIWRRVASKRSLPMSGLMAYLVTLYLWMVAVHISPIWVLVVPALHSLQYLAVVWRFERTRSSALVSQAAESASGFRGRSANSKFFLFVLNGIVLGLAGFWVLPVFLDSSVSSALTSHGAHFFAFAFWIFINVHHYFIDSVMWRSENADVKRYLFSAPASSQASAPVEARIAA